MNKEVSAISSQLAEAFKSACLAEIEALKPGNVHIFADGHGMVVQDFIKSAEIASVVIAQPELTVGERIHCAIEATWSAVGCNTNLGIVLLCAPLIHTALHGQRRNLRQSLLDVLQSLTVEDAVLTYQAIVRANPGGLGKSEKYDVHSPAGVTLLEAMREAQLRDRIAFQYANGFVDIFDFGVKRYVETMQRWNRPAWAATAVYLGFLARFDDSHIVRKFGVAAASSLREEAKVHEQTLLTLENPKQYQRELLKFDAELKRRGLNPGTSADLTVASLLVLGLGKAIGS